MDYRTWSEHWPWLSPLFVLLGWLGRRRALRPWRALVRQFNLNHELERCEQDLENERVSKEYAMVALQEMANAGSLVAKAAAEGRLTSSAPSSSERSTSRPRSIGSRPKRKRGPLDLP